MRVETPPHCPILWRCYNDDDVSPTAIKFSIFPKIVTTQRKYDEKQNVLWCRHGHTMRNHDMWWRSLVSIEKSGRRTTYPCLGRSGSLCLDVMAYFLGIDRIKKSTQQKRRVWYHQQKHHRARIVDEHNTVVKLPPSFHTLSSYKFDTPHSLPPRTAATMHVR